MRQNNKRRSQSQSDNQPVPVQFEFKDAGAQSVFVAGDFNQWNPKARALHNLGGGSWINKTALPPGQYEYLFVVDGCWQQDPQARESVPNPFGGSNSILTVAMGDKSDGAPVSSQHQLQPA